MYQLVSFLSFLSIFMFNFLERYRFYLQELPSLSLLSSCFYLLLTLVLFINKRFPKDRTCVFISVILKICKLFPSLRHIILGQISLSFFLSPHPRLMLVPFKKEKPKICRHQLESYFLEKRYVPEERKSIKNESWSEKKLSSGPKKGSL